MAQFVSLESSGELDFHVHAGMRKYEVDLKMWQHLLEHPLFAERAFHYINVLVSSLTCMLVYLSSRASLCAARLISRI